MNNYLKLVVTVINISVFYFTEITYIDVFVAYTMIFSILTLIIFNFFEFRNDFFSDKTSMKTEMLKGIQVNIKSVYNWILILTPLSFMFFGNHYYLSKPVNYIFLTVILSNLFINVSALNVIIYKLYQKKYPYYIIIIGVIFQFATKYFDFSVEKLLLIGCFYVVLFYLSILFIYIKNNTSFGIAQEI